MGIQPSIDERIASLVSDLDEGIRKEVQDALRTLRDAANVPGTIMTISRLLEGSRGLLGAIAAGGQHKLKGFELEKQINELAQKGIVPGEIASDLHWIRVRANKARHNVEKKTLTIHEAEVGLDRVLSVLEWFGCEYEHGPRLQTIYLTEYRPATLLERFAELQIVKPEDARSLQCEIEGLRADLQNSREQEMSRDPIPIPLPRLHGTFVNREAERDTLRRAMRDAGMRLIVIVAPGGYGKTELTTKVLKEVVPNTTIVDPTVHGILYIRCHRSDVSLGHIFSEAGRIVGKRAVFQQAYANHEVTLERKLEFFFGELGKTGDVWIVMDNFEGLLADDDSIYDAELNAFVEMAVSTEHNVRLIATTRAVPRFTGSQRVRPIDLSEGLPEAHAIEYLRVEGANYGLAESHEDLLRNFVKRVHRIPKALESVIGYLSEKYPIVKLSDLLSNDALFGDFDRFDTQNGLKNLIAKQFNDQTADLQLVLCALSIFQKPTPVAALHYILPALDLSSVLPRLERNRLISRHGDRFDMHPLVREYAYQKIPGDLLKSKQESREGAPAEILINTPTMRISGHMTEESFNRSSLHILAADFFAELRLTRSELKSLADLEPQLDEFYHRVCGGEYEKACVLLNEIDSEFLSLWGSYGQLVGLRIQLVNRLADKTLEMENYSELGDAYFYSGNVQKSRECYDRALALAVETGDRKSEGIFLGDLGDVEESLYQIQEGLDRYEAALTIAREINDHDQEADHLSSIGLVYLWMGQAQAALDYINRALDIARNRHDREREETQLGYLGIGYQDFRDIPRALQLYEEALAIARDIGDRSGEATHLCNLGSAYREIGEFQKAIQCHEEGWKISKRIGFLMGEGRDPECIGLVYHALGEMEKAITYYEEALTIDRGNERWGEGIDLCHLGRAYYDLGKMAESKKCFEQALEIAVEVSVQEEQYEALIGLGMVEYNGGSLSDARSRFEKAAQVDIPKTHYSCEPRLGIVHLEEGRQKEARHHLSRGIALCEALLVKTPNLYDALYHLALAELANRQPAKALATLCRALDVCSAKGVVKSALVDVQLLRRIPELSGVAEAEALLKEAILVGRRHTV